MSVELTRQRTISRRELLRGFAKGLTSAAAMTALNGSGIPIVRGPSLTDVIISKSDIPLEQLFGRSIDDAIAACQERRRAASENDSLKTKTPLAQLLGTRMSHSKEIGLINGHLFEEYERLDWTGPFLFAVNPLKVKKDGLLWFTNDEDVTAFRGDMAYSSLLHMEDRAIWALANGVDAVAVIELDSDEALVKLPDLITLLGTIGVKNFVVGNELNDPNTPWRNVPKRIQAALEIIDKTMHRMGKWPIGSHFSLPASIYDEKDNGSFLENLVTQMNSLGPIPYNRRSDHYYGPVHMFLPWIDRKKVFLGGDSGHYLTEVGNPGPDVYRTDVSDSMIAEGYIPQILTIAIGSGFFEKVFYHSLRNGNVEGHSLAQVKDGVLVPKDSLTAYDNMAQLFTNRKGDLIIEDHGGWMCGRGRRQTNYFREHEYAVVWSTRGDREFLLRRDDVLDGADVYSALGEKLDEEKNLIILRPKEEDFLAGAARIFVRSVA